jgi:hypothetical protein
MIKVLILMFSQRGLGWIGRREALPEMTKLEPKLMLGVAGGKRSTGFSR